MIPEVDRKNFKVNDLEMTLFDKTFSVRPLNVGKIFSFFLLFSTQLVSLNLTM